jgi:hypothetical protein
MGLKYEPKPRKRYLGEIVDLNNLPKLQREDFLGAAGTLLGLGADTVAHAYGLGGAYSTLKRTVRAFRNKRPHHDISSLVRMSAITKPKEPKPKQYPHQAEWDEFLARNAARKARRARSMLGNGG